MPNSERITKQIVARCAFIGGAATGGALVHFFALPGATLFLCGLIASSIVATAADAQRLTR